MTLMKSLLNKNQGGTPNDKMGDSLILSEMLA
jgi:hypothetical protein